jgi:hypothetical protein
MIGQNKLSAVRAAGQFVEVQLTNAQEVAGLQFSVRASTDLVLENVERGDRIGGANWLFVHHRVNDSTINFVILNSTGAILPSGAGALLTVSFHSAASVSSSRVSLSDVMIANASAESLGVVVEDLAWSNSQRLADAQTFSLQQNYPNPFNPSTCLSYTLNEPSQVRLSVYDMAGREVSRLVDDHQAMGSFQVVWNSADKSGRMMASGTYFARLQVGERVATRKMTLTK